MQRRVPLPQTIPVASDLVHETVYSAQVAGEDLDDLIVDRVLRQIGQPVIDRPGVTWKMVHRNETTATEGTRQIAEVTIVVDHRADAEIPASIVQVRSGDVVVLPPGHHWMDMNSVDGVAYVAVVGDKTFSR